MFEKELLKNILKEAMKEAGVRPASSSEGFPVIVRKGINQMGKEIVYIFNYSGQNRTASCPEGRYRELLTERDYFAGEDIVLDKWGFVILEAI